MSYQFNGNLPTLHIQYATYKQIFEAVKVKNYNSLNLFLLSGLPLNNLFLFYQTDLNYRSALLIGVNPNRLRYLTSLKKVKKDTLEANLAFNFACGENKEASTPLILVF